MTDVIKLNSNPRICFLIPTAYAAFINNIEGARSGAEFQMALVAQYLSEKGYNIEVVCQDKGHLVHHKSHIADYRLLPGISHANTVNLAIRYFMYIINNVADIYITRMMTPLLPVYRLATRLVRKPLVFSCASQYDVAKQFKGRNLLRFIIPACRAALINCDGVVTQTKWQKEELEINYRKESKVISNALNIDDWKPGNSPSGSKVVWLGNIRPVKRFDRLVRIAEMCPDIDFTAIGDISDASAHQTDYLPSNLHWVGRKGKSEVKRILQKSHILLNTSESEGFPNTILEARALGLFTIFFRIDSLSVGFFNQQEDLGKVVDTCHDASQAIYTYLKSNDEWKNRSRKVILSWVKNYSIEIVGQKWEKLIQSIVSPNDD
ncbi:MAG: glycosyltransferase family 4 protein [Candidatus Aegiribacteria sp.]|nr:glycosyltransferase family 4 protein [Candidatus Aegiribacteria sp.]